MKRFAKVAAITLTAMAGLYLIAGIGLQTILPPCVGRTMTSTPSPSGRFIAVVDQRVCEDTSKSWSRVLIGAPERGDKLVAIEVSGVVEMVVSWASDTRLQIAYADAPELDKPGQDWPAINIRPIPLRGT